MEVLTRISRFRSQNVLGCNFDVIFVLLSALARLEVFEVAEKMHAAMPAIEPLWLTSPGGRSGISNGPVSFPSVFIFRQGSGGD